MQPINLMRGSVPMSAAKLLLVEDDPQTRRELRTTLAMSGYAVIEARTGEEAWEEVRAEGAVDVVLLKIQVPGGLEACHRIRKMSTIPILAISERRSQEGKLQTFDAGADDYLVRPFGVKELLSRIRALRRRAFGAKDGPSFESGDLKIELDRRRVTVSGDSIHLTPGEFELLSHLVRHEGKPVAYNTLLHSLWGPGHSREIERLRVAVNQLRRKIELEPRRVRYIHTHHSFGYRFEAVRQGSEKRKKKTKISVHA